MRLQSDRGADLRRGRRGSRFGSTELTVRRVATTVAALGLLVSAGCFDEPVREDLTLQFQADDHLTLTLATRLSNPSREEATVEVQARLEEERRRLQSGEDDWTYRFGELSAARDWVTHGRTDGVLTAVDRRAEVDLGRDPEALQRFFSDTLVAATWRTTPEGRELFLEPLAATRATYRERQRLARRLESWTAAVAAYFTTAGELYQYLDRNPERRPTVFGVILEDALVETDRAEEENLLAAEKPLVDALGDAMGEVLEVLAVEPGEAFSMNEISRLAFDPFPARVRIELPTDATAVEGFVAAEAQRVFQVPEVSLWSALEALTTERLSPDPLALLVASETGMLGRTEPAPPRSLEAVAGGELKYPADADATELRREVEARLAAQPVYRLAW